MVNILNWNLRSLNIEDNEKDEKFDDGRAVLMLMMPSQLRFPRGLVFEHY